MDGNRRSLITKNGQTCITDCATTRSVSIISSSIVDDDVDDQGRPLSLTASTICSTKEWDDRIGPSHLPVSSTTPAMSTNSSSSSSNDTSSSMIKPSSLHENHSPNKDGEAPRPLPPVSPHPQQHQHQSLVEQARAPSNNEHAHVSPLPAVHSSNNMQANNMFASTPSSTTIQMDQHHPPAISTSKQQQQQQHPMPLDMDEERPAGSACCCIIC